MQVLPADSSSPALPTPSHHSALEGLESNAGCAPDRIVSVVALCSTYSMLTFEFPGSKNMTVLGEWIFKEVTIGEAESQGGRALPSADYFPTWLQLVGPGAKSRSQGTESPSGASMQVGRNHA